MYTANLRDHVRRARLRRHESLRLTAIMAGAFRRRRAGDRHGGRSVMRAKHRAAIK